MTGCLADSPRPVPMHVCFYIGFDWASLSACSRQEKGLETAGDPPPWQPGCMFGTTSFRSKMISVGCQHNRSTYEPCTVYEITSVCVCRGRLLLYQHLMRAHQIHFTRNNQQMNMNECNQSRHYLFAWMHFDSVYVTGYFQPIRLSACA